MAAHQRTEHLIKSTFPEQDVQDDRGIIKNFHGVINAGGNEDQVAFRKLFTVQAYVLDTMAFIHINDLEKIMPVQESRCIAVMPDQHDIFVNAFFKVFTVIHFIGNDLRQQLMNDQMPFCGIFQIYSLQKFLQDRRIRIPAGQIIIFIENLIFI